MKKRKHIFLDALLIQHSNNVRVWHILVVKKTDISGYIVFSLEVVKPVVGLGCANVLW